MKLIILALAAVLFVSPAFAGDLEDPFGASPSPGDDLSLFALTPGSREQSEPGFAEKYQRDYNIFNPINELRPDNPLNPINSIDPNNPFNPINSIDPGNPANPINHYNPNNPFNPINKVNPENPLNPINRYNPTTPFEPLD